VLVLPVLPWIQCCKLGGSNSSQFNGWHGPAVRLGNEPNFHIVKTKNLPVRCYGTHFRYYIFIFIFYFLILTVGVPQTQCSWK
jgi:hypothetical protein